MSQGWDLRKNTRSSPGAGNTNPKSGYESAVGPMLAR
jgi:hypothetical protein